MDAPSSAVSSSPGVVREVYTLTEETWVQCRASSASSAARTKAGCHDTSTTASHERPATAA
ncbi:hypothetical protein JOD57_002322 [Geodermatophilus bullaregiensis]|uniref:hypothetical protein n=1 Tax=Geodermatophilus bullaregiensis TaxID=1564160 RepID=UPI00195E412F|nr:hypothetical protein [Geodermatophilus bullaregiensis]MBM7806485.1 hypothetical protein [Geodermatophilus bullaregiensis]